MKGPGSSVTGQPGARSGGWACGVRPEAARSQVLWPTASVARVGGMPGVARGPGPSALAHCPALGLRVDRTSPAHPAWLFAAPWCVEAAGSPGWGWRQRQPRPPGPAAASSSALPHLRRPAPSSAGREAVVPPPTAPQALSDPPAPRALPVSWMCCGKPPASTRFLLPRPAQRGRSCVNPQSKLGGVWEWGAGGVPGAPLLEERTGAEIQRGQPHGLRASGDPVGLEAELHSEA